jgi:predicted nuclease of predicted toxin-antitoxin system
VRFLADMGVHRLVVDWLDDQGHDVAHLSDLGLHKLPDPQIFEKAVTEDRVVLTFDLDFGEITAYAKGKRAGVVLFRLHNTRAHHVIGRLSRVLADSSAALEEGAIVIVEEGRHRVRRFEDVLQSWG